MAGIRQGSVRLARRVLAGALAAAMATTGCTADRPRAAADGDARRTTDAAARPRSMAALGDSITRAFATCGRGGDCVENSWATGTAPGVDSHWQRLAVGAADGNHNVAVSGARVAGLGAQVQAALRVRPGYVTVLIGANDACAGDEAAMTPVGEFTSAFDAAVDALARGLPDARILVLSIPDLSRLWEVGRDRPEVVRAWESYRICQSMLAAATDRGADAQARRERVRDRVIAYNTAMGAACARHPQCRHDRNAVFDYRFDLADVSTVDYWHPSSRGQATLARVGWEAGFWS